MNRDFINVGIIGSGSIGTSIARIFVDNDKVEIVDLRERLKERQLLKIPIVSNAPLEWQSMCWPVYETQKAIRNRGRKRIRNVMKSAKNYWLWEALYFPKTN